MGQSKKSLAVRLKEHQRALYTGDSNISALVEHAITIGHEIDWLNATVLDSPGVMVHSEPVETT